MLSFHQYFLSSFSFFSLQQQHKHHGVKHANNTSTQIPNSCSTQQHLPKPPHFTRYTESTNLPAHNPSIHTEQRNSSVANSNSTCPKPCHPPPKTRK